MELEAVCFTPGAQENREVYERRIEIFPEGALIASVDSQSAGCIFSEIWTARSDFERGQFALGHDIMDTHDVIQGTELYIASMAIDPAFQGRRLAMPLLIGCIDRLAKKFPHLKSALLIVNETLTRARNVYRTAGFVEIGKLDNFFCPFGTYFDAGLLMRRNLIDLPTSHCTTERTSDH